MLLWERVRSVALDAGLDAVGVGRAEPFLETRRHLVERKAAGLHGGMHWRYGRSPIAHIHRGAYRIVHLWLLDLGLYRHGPLRASIQQDRPVHGC